MFDKLLATVYLEHRQLITDDQKNDYINEYFVEGSTVETLEREMDVVAREFHAMIDRMINETEGE